MRPRLRDSIAKTFSRRPGEDVLVGASGGGDEEQGGEEDAEAGLTPGVAEAEQEFAVDGAAGDVARLAGGHEEEGEDGDDEDAGHDEVSAFGADEGGEEEQGAEHGADGLGEG